MDIVTEPQPVIIAPQPLPKFNEYQMACILGHCLSSSISRVLGKA